MATQVEVLRQSASQAWDAFSAEMAKYNDDNLPTPEQSAHIDTLRTAATAAQKDTNAAEQFAKDRATWESQEAQMRGARSNPVATREDVKRPERLVSVGQRFVDSQAYKSFIDSYAGAGGIIPETTQRLNSGRVQFQGMRDLDMSAALLTGDSSTSAGAFVVPGQYPGLTELARRPLTIRQVITNLTTDSDVVEYVRVTTETNAAATVAEATAADGGSGVKPESVLAFERVSTAVKTIAHWIPATKRALSDAGQLRGLIDAFLRYGLDEELEDQIVNGNAVGEDFTGFANVSGTQSQAWDTNLLQTLRVAKRKVRTVGRRVPTAFILNPEDWERIELAQDNQYRYYGNGPFGVTPPSVWGLPVIESEAVTAGVGYAGDWSTCVLWDREQANISVSDSHSDFFIRNLVAILAELRAAFGILKPNAIVEIDLTA